MNKPLGRNSFDDEPEYLTEEEYWRGMCDAEPLGISKTETTEPFGNPEQLPQIKSISVEVILV